MEVTPFEQTVVLGPCPGCLNWQVDYNTKDYTSYEECVATVEFVLREHLAECRHLQLVLGPDWQRA